MKYKDFINFQLPPVTQSELTLVKANSFHFIRRAIESRYPSVEPVENMSESYSGEDRLSHRHQSAIFSYSRGFVLVDYLHFTKPSSDYARVGEERFDQRLFISSEAISRKARNSVSEAIIAKITKKFPDARRF